MSKKKETILECFLKSFVGFVGFVASMGLAGLVFSINWVIAKNASPLVSKIIMVSLCIIMTARVLAIYYATHRAIFKRDEITWKRRTLACIYSVIPSVVSFSALKPAYGRRKI